MGYRKCLLGDYLTSTDHVFPNWLQLTILAQAETSIRLDIKSQFSDADLAQETPFGAFFFFFNNGLIELGEKNNTQPF